MSIKQKIKKYKMKKGTKPDRKAAQKIFNEAYMKQMVETELYLLGWEVRKIMDDMRLERAVLDAVLEDLGVKDVYYRRLYGAS